jgi:phosphoserine phosphatase
VLVTATTRFIAEIFAQQFGLDDLIATESARDTAGHLTGEVIGEPCWGPHKIAHVEAWLARQNAPRLAECAFSAFYSDSASDLPLLRSVHHPVAVRPDDRLRCEALGSGWPIRLDL